MSFKNGEISSQIPSSSTERQAKLSIWDKVLEILNEHDIPNLETADDGEIEDLTDKISLFLSSIAGDHERQAGQGIVNACYELLIIPVKAKLEPNQARINYLEIPENLKVNRKTIYKLIKPTPQQATRHLA